METPMLVPLNVAAGWFPKRDGRKLSLKAIRRRIHKGIGGVRLQARRDGGEWFTCREWVDAFSEAITAAAVAPAAPPRRSVGVTSERSKSILARPRR